MIEAGALVEDVGVGKGGEKKQCVLFIQIV